MLNILFVLYEDFHSNSAVHVHHFANNLVSLGYDCVVSVPKDKTTVSKIGTNLYKVINFAEYRSLKNLFFNKKAPDVVHAWTPREVVRVHCKKLRETYNFKLFIHLEDNEEYLLEKFLQTPYKQLLKNDTISIPSHLAHPRKYHEFLATANGITIIIDSLKQFVPKQIPTLTLWPGADTEHFFPREADPELANSLGVPLNSIVFCYTGNVHVANMHEVRSLYLAVAMMNREGLPTVLIRTGKDFCKFLGDDDTWARKYSIDLGYVERAKLPDILALADVLVQPGRPDNFNNYRFPSKLSEFLAMGKPVILPAANIGSFMKDMSDALVLPVVDALHIMDATQLLLRDQALYQKLSFNAISFVDDHLNWAKNSKLLKSFYETILDENNEYQRNTLSCSTSR